MFKQSGNEAAKRQRLLTDDSDHRKSENDAFDPLPEHVLLQIALSLDDEALVTLWNVSRPWKAFLQHERVWKTKCSQNNLTVNKELGKVSKTPFRDTFLSKLNVRRNWECPQQAVIVKMDEHNSTDRGQVIGVVEDRVLTLNSQKKLTAWSPLTGVRLWERFVQTEHVFVDTIIVAVNFSNGNGAVISASSGDIVQTWHMGVIERIAIHRDRVVSLDNRDFLHLWSPTSRTYIATLGRVQYLVDFFMFNGESVITASVDGLIEVWSVSLCKQIHEYPNFNAIKSLVMNEENMYISYTDDIVVRSWSLGEDHTTKCLIFKQDSVLHLYDEFLVGIAPGTIVRVWDRPTMMCLYNLDIDTPINGITMQSAHLVAHTAEGRLKFWNISHGVRSDDVELELPERCQVHTIHTTESKLVVDVRKADEILPLMVMDFTRRKDKEIGPIRFVDPLDNALTVE